ncbi:MAG: ABC transporter [Myxococcales bacterium]|nr:ABC transporter [Myxococcales bacterium]
MIQVQGLIKDYSDFRAVNNVSFEVKAGEVFGFLGPNGAGKTTTMRMIAGLLMPTQGRISIGGFDLATQAKEAKRISSFIPDRPYLYEKLTAMEFLLFVGGLYQLDRAHVLKKAGEMLHTFGLTDWRDAMVENFSHGMKQRLVFSAALLTDPKVLIVDEPMVGLDPKGAKLVKNVFRELCHNKGLTVFVSTHTMDVAQEVCDRIAIIHKGEIAALGTLAEIENQVGVHNSRLEDIFLQITEETSDIQEGDSTS